MGKPSAIAAPQGPALPERAREQRILLREQVFQEEVLQEQELLQQAAQQEEVRPLRLRREHQAPQRPRRSTTGTSRWRTRV